MTLPLGNGIRTGAQYLVGLQDERDVWLSGEKVPDVTSHSTIKRVAKTLAHFMDKQHDTDLTELLTHTDENGKRYGMSFLIPKNRADIEKRGKAFYECATWSGGMFGRTPDYKNASLTAFAGAADFLSENGKHFKEHMLDYYEYAKSNDKVLTHTLINPTYNHAQYKNGKLSEKVALHVVKETDAGIIVKGARLLATLGPIADEIEVFPSSLLTASKDNINFSFAFAIPINSKGVRLICRDSYDFGKSFYDAPLASRFEEMDAVVIFDDVLVPWERIFMYKDPLLCNRAFAETHAVTHMMHQVVCSKLAKSEFIVGLLCAMAKATGKDKDSVVKGQIAEAMWITETIRAFRFSAEQQAEADQWGNYVPLRRPLDTSRNLFPKMYPRLIEIVQTLGSSSLVATPCEDDLNNDITEDIEKYFQTINLSSKDRIALFRLANDVSVSAFAGRQTLYERFFFGPPNIMSNIYFDLYPRDEMIAKVDDMMKKE